MLAVLLLAQHVLGVDDLAPRERDRAVVRHVARVERGVDRERQRLERREEELGAAAGERQPLGQRAEDEQRLVRLAALGRRSAARAARPSSGSSNSRRRSASSGS